MSDPIARMIGKSPTGEDQLRDMRSAVWHAQGIAVIRPDDVANDWDRQIIINAAEKLYGKRQPKDQAA